jgi:hypothetical protein
MLSLSVQTTDQKFISSCSSTIQHLRYQLRHHVVANKSSPLPTSKLKPGSKFYTQRLTAILSVLTPSSKLRTFRLTSSRTCQSSLIRRHNLALNDQVMICRCSLSSGSQGCCNCLLLSECCILKTSSPSTKSASLSFKRFARRQIETPATAL